MSWPDPTNWRKWLDLFVDLNTLAALARHTSACAGAILVFLLVGWLVRWGVPKGAVRNMLESVEDGVLVGLFLWFIVQLAGVLWKQRVRFNDGTAASVLV